MVGVELNGRLGNQMFEYAFIYANSKEKETTYFLLKKGSPIELYKYFKLENSLFISIDRLIFNTASCKLFFSHYARGFFYAIIKKLYINNVSQIDNTEEPTLADIKRDATIYYGYFQSPLYFAGHQQGIKSLFEIKDSIISKYRTKFKFLFRKHVVAVHIRKTDYLDLEHLNLGGKDLSLPIEYFKKIISGIHSEDNFYVFLSDDIDLVKSAFSYLENSFFSKDTAINDFLHLYFAKTLIISNSSFSWWAAYLNKNEEKEIYCPKYFLGHLIKKEYPTKIYPSNWHQIEVN
ncbi:alpha-1,2-fucosyltransferase [Pedobacter paludis]|uniref:Alpha-1,2-fucosyltransferase n=1 Tax=Pedobacter paludis TaxID=2203212 RepID=A0A317F2H9_9SPHI|nr:alpha-1,2-fucosyltransferase [Pedobacter paludis]PWS31688.1 hypothetical protein DF947_13970 [Pedobacter paludis]